MTLIRCLAMLPRPTRILMALIGFTLTSISRTNADILVFSTADTHRVEQVFRDLPARFGGTIPAEGIKGLVVYADPSTACEEIKSPPTDKKYFGYNWIVLIARLNCTFEVKVRNAEKAGYDAAIIHNVNSNELEPMSAKDSTNITIPSVFVSEFSGSLLKNVYSYNEDYFVLINDLPININTHLLLPFAIVVGICFLVMVIFMIIKCIKDRRRQRRHRLPNSSLKKIPTHKYTKGDPYETCAICLDDYVENEKLRVLPCAHAYHTKCIDPWLTKNRRVCPVCKRKVFAADERVESDSESDSDADDSTPLIREGQRVGTQGGTFNEPTEEIQDADHLAQVERILQRRGQQLFRQFMVITSQHSQPSSSGSSYNSVDDLIEARKAIHEASGNHEDDFDINASTSHADVIPAELFGATERRHCRGEAADLEKSASSTKPHTVNLSTDFDENLTADVSHPRAERHTRNGNRSDGAINPFPNVVLPQTKDDVDVVI